MKPAVTEAGRPMSQGSPRRVSPSGRVAGVALTANTTPSAASATRIGRSPASRRLPHAGSSDGEDRTSRLETLGLLAASVAHDFNNYMTAISGHVDLARRGVSDEDLDDALGEIERAASRAATL